ncbi:hypothetical protein ABTY59_24130 [Streptomyces sp. NPDC096079]|uniref:hypothetical protein n=1 Tax=unclassified Streptomyces TaxID=2593676 RepID=UPI0033311C7C
MSGRRHLAWLGLTPEPERELPAAVAALRASLPTARHPPVGPAPPASAERRRVERLVLRGGSHSWLRYLAEVTALITAVADGLDEPRAQEGTDADTATEAALLAAEVILDHHRMLIGLPGAGYGRTAGDRAALEDAIRLLRARSHAAEPAPTARTGEGR